MAINQQLLQANPDDQEKRWGVAQGHAWLSDALKGAGDIEAAREQRDAELQVYSTMLEQDSRDARALEGSVVALLQIADLSLSTGQYESALDSARRALTEILRLVDEDASNAFWQDLAVSAHNRTVEALMLIGDWEAASILNKAALERAESMAEADATVTSRITNGLMNARWMELVILASTEGGSAADQGLLEFERDFGRQSGLTTQEAIVPWTMVYAMMVLKHHANDHPEAAATAMKSIRAFDSSLPRVVAVLDYLERIASEHSGPEIRVVRANDTGYDPALILQRGSRSDDS
jgi:tetratricopeptide (TPR) repeat protein